MAEYFENKEREWIDRAKAEGSVPHLDPDNCVNGWSTPPGNKFMVRGPDYFSTKVKIPAGDYLLTPIGFDWVRSSVKIGEILNHPNNRIRKLIEDMYPNGLKPFIWAFNLQVPGKDNYSAVAYFTTTRLIPKGSLIDQFLKGDDGFRNSRLKLIANIVEGPWIVKRAVGEQAICIIGRALSCKYILGEKFLEVDIDIGSSMVANAIVHLAFGYVTNLTVDLAFLIESQTESELPERLLGSVRFSHLNPSSASQIDSLSDSDQTGMSFQSRLWRSIGQGFSHILQPSGQESGSNTGSGRTNGDEFMEESDKAVKE